MKARWMVMAALPLLAAAGAIGTARASSAAQDAKNGGLKRVVEEPRDAEEAFDKDAWRKKLAAADLSKREKAFEELADLARHDRDARKAVEEWSGDGKDAELAWTSRLLLREIDRRGGPGAFRRDPAAGWRNLRGWGGFDWDDFSRRFEDLDSMFGDLRQEWGDMLRNLPAPSAGSNSSSKSLTLESGPDGVKCTVKEEVDGKEQSHTYEAKSMDELLEAHPELRDSLGGSSFHLFRGSPHGPIVLSPPGGPLGVMPRLGVAPRIDGFGREDRGSGPRTDRLGINCSEVSKDRAKELGLEAGLGLEVQSVVPGTIAGLIGLRGGDVVTEVNGTAIHSREDVKKVLSERASDADVAVVVVGDDGHRRTLTWRPGAAERKSEGGQKSSRDL